MMMIITLRGGGACLSRHLRRLFAVYDVRNKSNTVSRTTSVDGTTIVTEQLRLEAG